MANVRSVVQVAVSGTSARTASALSLGQKYALSATTDLYWLQGTSAVTAAANTGFYLRSGAIFVIAPQNAEEAYVAAIRATADGTLTIALMENE